MSRRGTRAGLLVVLATVAFALGAALVLDGAEAPAGASAPAATTSPAHVSQTDAGPGGDEVPSTTALPPPPNIIPRPNSGVEPQDAGDRGGALQASLFFLILLAMAAIGFLVWRESRKVRGRRGF